jgi:hypothetical protein
MRVRFSFIVLAAIVAVPYPSGMDWASTRGFSVARVAMRSRAEDCWRSAFPCSGETSGRKGYTLTARCGFTVLPRGFLGGAMSNSGAGSNTEEVLERWRRRALLLAGPMRFGAELVNEASEIVRLVLGPDWLAREALPRDTGDAWGARSHPIGTALVQADRQGVALILELAVYLKVLAPMPSYGTVVAGLKADFRSTLLQLSFAQRVSALGARDLVLEPPVESGRLGDVAFVFSSQAFVAECYVQRAARWTTSTEGMWLLRRIVKVLEHRPLGLCVAIQLKKPLDAALRKDLVASTQRLVGQLERSPGEALLETRTEWVVSIVNSGPGGALFLHPGFPTGLGEPLMGMNSRMVQPTRP